ncbi:MAG TPA: DsbA family protein [Pirellulales bacterium]
MSRRAALAAFLLTTVDVTVLSTLGAAANDMAALVAKPVALPDMVLGSAMAPITIVEYSSLTCSHCAAFAENVFPMLQAKYIETGKVRFVSREFPLELKAAAASMLARCAANGDRSKYFDATTMLFRQQQDLIERATETLTMIGDKFGMSQAAVESCIKDDATLDKLQADQNFAYRELNVDATPTFFINGEQLKGSMSFEELEAKLAPLLKHR